MIKTKIELSPSSVERVETAAALIKTKYGITAAATGEDFKRICKGEGIKVIRLPLRHKGYGFNFQNNAEDINGKWIVFSKGKTPVSLRTKFYFIGSHVIPSMLPLKKLFAGEIPESECLEKFNECELFASILLSSGSAKAKDDFQL